MKATTLPLRAAKARFVAVVSAAFVFALTTLVALRAEALVSGQLTQAQAPIGCVSETGSAGDCIDGRALDSAFSVAVSADGKSVYVASRFSDAVAAFRRDATTGKLTQLAGTAGCVSETGTGGMCANGKALDEPRSVAVSPEGTSVYVTSFRSDAVAVFRRDTSTGRLTQLAGTAGCVSETGSGGACANGKGLDGPQSVAVTADGASAYVASAVGDSISAFERNTTTGTLTQLAGTAGCVSETGSGGACTNGRALDGASSVKASPDGNSVYVASQASDAVAVLARNPTTGQLVQLSGAAGCISEAGSAAGCAEGKALDGARSIAVSADGKSVYVASLISDAVAAFARNTTSGRLVQLLDAAGCVSEDGTSGEGGLPGDCGDGTALDGVFEVAVSGDGKSVYAASSVSDAVVAFRRNASGGRLTQLPGQTGCISETGSGGACADGKALDGAVSLATAADGKSVYVISSISDAVAVFRRDTTTGELTQIASGCVSETASGGTCEDGKALDEARSVAITADGRNVYVASRSSDAVAVFARDTTTGNLAQLGGTAGCVSETGSGGTCADGKALDAPSSVAVSSDGTSVYAASLFGSAVAVFRRNATTGALTQLAGTAGCVSETGSGGACADGKALDGVSSLAVSADGKNVYAASRLSDALAVFQRAAANGALTQLAGTAGCISETGSGGACIDGKALDLATFGPGGFEVTVSPDETSVYVASASSDAVAVFHRDTTTGALTQLGGMAGCVSETGSGGDCADGKALNGAISVAVSADGKSVYVTSNGGVAVFARNLATGELVQLAGTAGCITASGSGGVCADGRALARASSVAVSADGENVYVASESSDAVAAFARDTTSGALTQLPGKAGCISETGSSGSCTDGKALTAAFSVAASSDGKSVYVASRFSDAVAILARVP